MKKILAVIFMIFMILGCNQEKKVNASDLNFIQGKVYLVGKNKPFTGKVIYNSHQIKQEINIASDIQKENSVISWGEEGYEGYYKDGLKDGKWIYYYPDNKVLKEGNYKNGYKIGEWTYYSKSGIELYKVDYSILGEKAKEYEENEISFSNNVAYLKNSDKKISGVVYSKFPFGKLEKVTLYKDGIKEGFEIYFFDNEVIRAIYKYKNGVIDGKVEIKYSNGAIKVIGLFSNDKKEGEWTYYYENGKLKGKGLFLNNEKAREWTYYYENEQLKEKGSFLNGKKEGEWTYYYENGKLKEKGLFLSDKKEKEWTYYYENEQLKEKGSFLNGKKEGEWTYYYESGKLKEKGLFFDGLKKGEWIYYYEDGKIKERRMHMKSELFIID